MFNSFEIVGLFYFSVWKEARKDIRKVKWLKFDNVGDHDGPHSRTIKKVTYTPTAMKKAKPCEVVPIGMRHSRQYLSRCASYVS